MKRRHSLLMLLIVVIMTSLSGCASKSFQEGTEVMFKGPLFVNNDGVYFNGMSVGTIKSVDTDSANITKVVIVAQSDFKNQLGDRFVVYAHAGRLEMDALKSFGNPLDTGMPLCGFSSKSELRWFKFKTLLKDPVAAARERAQALSAQFVN